MSQNQDRTEAEFVKKCIAHFEEKVGVFEPDKLKFFTPLLLQYFIPETPLECQGLDANNYYAFALINRQYYDLFSALLYAETEILPHFRLDNLDKLTATQIATWLREIHRRAGNTIVTNDGVVPGEYSTSIVMRWHAGINFISALQRAWEFGTEKDIHQVFSQYEISDHDRDLFWNKIRSLMNDESIEVPPSELEGVDMESISEKQKQYLMGTLRFAIAHHKHLFTQEEETAFRHIVTVCKPADEIPGAVEAYANELLAKMKVCEKTDEAICELVSWSYQAFMILHPFPNSNGRTATTFSVNCVFHAFACPSIIMRTPEQKADKNSRYNKAIDCIEADRGPLTEHINAQLQLARLKGRHPNQRKLNFIREKVLFALRIWGTHENMVSHSINAPAAIEVLKVYYRDKVKPHLLKIANERAPVRYIEILKRAIPGASDPKVKWKYSMKGGLSIWVEGYTSEEAEKINELIQYMLKKTTGIPSL